VFYRPTFLSSITRYNLSGEAKERQQRLAKATPSSRGLQWFTRIPLGSLVDPQSQDRRRSCSSIRPVLPVGLTGLISGEHRSDRCATVQSEDFEEEDTRRDRKACVEAKQVYSRWASV
jgi:hypothetical protein